MAFLDVVGELFGFSDQKAWTLEGDDAKFSDLKFIGQFVPQNYDEGGGDMALAEATTINKQQPNFQYLSNEGETVTFTSRLFATNSFKNVKQQIELLRSFSKRDDDLKRPPKFLFTYGTEIQYTCFVKRVTFQYDELRSDGSIRGCIANITLQKLDQTAQGSEAAATSLASQIKFAAGIVAGAAGIIAQVKDKINIPGGSLHTIDRTVIAVQGDTFESIAKREYGNASQGDILRRTQPQLANLKIGDKVVLVDPTEINEISITPQSTPMKNTRDNQALKNEFFDLRNRKTTIFV